MKNFTITIEDKFILIHKIYKQFKNTFPLIYVFDIHVDENIKSLVHSPITNDFEIELERKELLLSNPKA